ncbi:glycosylated lysosomal membrane protein [Rana temporaria]|uniref:glycosylated lysosomal membrane protein n=1 Tax=Rana temporaria TaxID=8407 RepID=UPI001AAD1FD5|nr:glycosylated lysosomal membrane protein [Rana temporaria]
MRVEVQLLLWALCVGLGATGAPEEEEETRKVSLELNPGSSNSTENLLHIRAVGNGSTIHYVWSTIGAPTVLLIYTDSEHTQLKVNWTKLLSPEPHGAIRVEPANRVRYSTALLFTRIFEYKDINNTANFTGTDRKLFYPPYELSGFTWGSARDSMNSSSLTARLSGVNSTDPNFNNGSVSFQVSAYKGSGRDRSSPQLLHNANCTKMEFVLSGVKPRGNNSRFALEMVTLEKKAGRKKMKSVRSIDDEYTPTIFEVMELVPDTPNTSHALGYFQWKSVAYGTAEGGRANALPCKMYRPRSLNETLRIPSIVYAFYGEDLADGYNIEAYNVSFGIADGDFYDKHGFLGWSALIGYGTPPRDSFSVLVMCIMAVALGAPLVLLIVGSIVVVVMRRKTVTPSYEPVN